MCCFSEKQNIQAAFGWVLEVTGNAAKPCSPKGPKKSQAVRTGPTGQQFKKALKGFSRCGVQMHSLYTHPGLRKESFFRGCPRLLFPRSPKSQESILNRPLSHPKGTGQVPRQPSWGPSATWKLAFPRPSPDGAYDFDLFARGPSPENCARPICRDPLDFGRRHNPTL